MRKRPFVLSAGYLLRWCLPGRRRLNSITWELVFFKSIDIDRAFRAVDQALSLYRGLSDTEGEIEAYRLKATLYGGFAGI